MASIRHTVGRLYRVPFHALAGATGCKLPVRFNGRWTWWPAAIWPGFRAAYEPYMEATLRRLLSPGMGFADVGAHHGIWSGVARDLVGPGGRVVAAEPSPAFGTLSAHLAGPAHVRLVNAAVGAAAGTATFYAQGELTTGSLRQDITELCQSQAPDEAIKPITVPVTTLDELLGPSLAERRWVVKVDVEGNEADVIAGASQLVASAAVDWLIEIHPPMLKLAGKTESDVLGPLERAGYAVKVLDRSPTTLYTVAATRDPARLP